MVINPSKTESSGVVSKNFRTRLGDLDYEEGRLVIFFFFFFGNSLRWSSFRSAKRFCPLCPAQSRISLYSTHFLDCPSLPSPRRCKKWSELVLVAGVGDWKLFFDEILFCLASYWNRASDFFKNTVKETLDIFQEKTRNGSV